MVSKKVITIYLMGGFGNQLSQIYMGFLIAESGRRVILVDNLLYKNFISKIFKLYIHEYILDKFIINNKNITIKTNSFFKSLVDMLFLNLSYKLNITIFKKYKFDLGNECINFLELKAASVICGYWQNGSIYDENNLKNFKEQLQIKVPPGFNTNPIKVGIHFRGGDKPVNKRMNANYYKKCLNKLSEKSYIVFTDDKNEAAKIFTDKNIKFEFSESKSAFQDFLKMLNSESLICSESTFCFWSALLSEKKIVMIPNSKHFHFIKNNCFQEYKEKTFCLV